MVFSVYAQNAFAQLDTDILRSARLWGAKDGTTALTAVHAGQFLFIANAGRLADVSCHHDR